MKDLHPIAHINNVLNKWKRNMGLVQELYRLRRLRDLGNPGWDNRIAFIECIIYGGCSEIFLGQITSGSGFPGEGIAPEGNIPVPGQPPDVHAKPSLSTNQVSIADSPTLISAINRTRDGIVIKNLGTIIVYIGDYNVTTSTGYPLSPNEAATFPTSAPIYGRIASGNPNQTVTYAETGKED